MMLSHVVRLCAPLLFAAGAASAQLTGATEAGAAPAALGGGSGGAGLPSGFQAASEAVSQGGMAVRILFLGRNPDGEQLTVSTQLTNTNEEPINVALIGPPPTAIDTRGVQYELASIAGIGRCSRLEHNWVDGCMGNAQRSLPNTHFAHLAPGASTIMALTFTAPAVSEDGFMSVSMNFAVGAGERVTDDNRAELRNFPITFPIVSLVSETQ